MKYILIFFFLYAFTLSYCQYYELYSSRSKALGNCSVALTEEVLVFQNPISAILDSRYALGCYYSSSWQLKELSQRGFCGVWNGAKGAFASGISQFGFSAFSQNRVVMSFARRYGKVKAGLQGNYLQNRFVGRYSYTTFFSNMAMQISLSEVFDIGFSLVNAERSVFRYPDYEEPIPTILKIGSGWELSKSMELYNEVVYSTETNVVVNLGLEQVFSETIAIRGGMVTKPLQHTLGLGIITRKIICDVSFVLNRITGTQSSCSISYQF